MQSMIQIHALTGHDFDKSIVVYCKSGGRSAVAKQVRITFFEGAYRPEFKPLMSHSE